MLLSAQMVPKDSCLLSTTVRAFIKEASDTIISKQTLAKGFELQLSDTSFKVSRFSISFYAGDNVFHHYVVAGSKLDFTKKDTSLIFVNSLKRATRTLYVDGIKIKKGRFCFYAKAIYYFIDTKPDRTGKIEKYYVSPLVH
jgi:hypothetical protein